MIPLLPGGVNPGTPVYVGDLCIILRRQKYTSRLMYHTFTSKASLFPAAKKNMLIHMYLFFGKNVQWALAKKRFAYKFNSYVVSTERETKNLQPELSHRIHSCARQQVKSPIKAPRQ